MSDQIELPEGWTSEQMEAARRQMDEIDKAMIATRNHQHDEAWKEWLVDLPEYDKDGVKIERFTVSEREANIELLRAYLNPQRPNRAIQAGEFTKITVDGVMWMSDTPAEVADLLDVDEMMAVLNAGWLLQYPAPETSSILIVGLGLGLVVNRAITAHSIQRIDVVERDWRVIDAVAPHYDALARDHGITLNIHRADIHQWRAPRGRTWDIGWFDIWEHISEDDLPEVKRLRDRFRNRLGWFGAWAQADRLAQKKRMKTGMWAY